jgi:hypothetical protein
MRKRILWLAGLLALLGLILNIQLVLAHESISAGDYEIVYGWVSEPPVAGQSNGIEIHVSKNSTGEAQPVEDVSSLIVTLAYGGQSKELAFEALGEHNPGEFQAPVLPTIPGQYTLHFSGRLDETTFVDAIAEPEEVQPADTLAFPNVDATQPEAGGFGRVEWIAIAGLISGLAGLVLSLWNMRKSR